MQTREKAGPKVVGAALDRRRGRPPRTAGRAAPEPGAETGGTGAGAGGERGRREREGVPPARGRGRHPVRVRGGAVQERDRGLADVDPVPRSESRRLDDRPVERDVRSRSTSEHLEPELFARDGDWGMPSEHTAGAHDEVISRRGADMDDISMDFADFRFAARLADLETQHGNCPPTEGRVRVWSKRRLSRRRHLSRARRHLLDGPDRDPGLGGPYNAPRGRTRPHARLPPRRTPLSRP